MTVRERLTGRIIERARKAAIDGQGMELSHLEVLTLLNSLLQQQMLAQRASGGSDGNNSSALARHMSRFKSATTDLDRDQVRTMFSAFEVSDGVHHAFQVDDDVELFFSSDEGSGDSDSGEPMAGPLEEAASPWGMLQPDTASLAELVEQPDLRQPLLDQLAGVAVLDFDIWQFVDSAGGVLSRGNLCRQMSHAVFRLHRKHLKSISIPAVVFDVFVGKALEAYNDLPYHNCLHAVDTLQSISSLLLESTPFYSSLAPVEILATLVAALCHDMGHPGVNNHFLVESQDSLAQHYNDQAVLENMHAGATMELMAAQGSNLLAHVTADQRKSMRSSIIGMILATDMSRHLQEVSLITKKLDDAAAANGQVSSTDRSNKQSMLELLMHAADVSNPGRLWRVHHRWSTLIMEEFYAQRDQELQLGLPASMPARDQPIDQLQIGFLRFIQPLFIAINRIAGLDVSYLVTHMEANLKAWERGRRTPSPVAQHVASSPDDA